MIAEHFLANNVATHVIAVPKTIDGDMKNQDVAISFGFDTAAKVFSELIGNIMTDSARWGGCGWTCGSGGVGGRGRRPQLARHGWVCMRPVACGMREKANQSEA